MKKNWRHVKSSQAQCGSYLRTSAHGCKWSSDPCKWFNPPRIIWICICRRTEGSWDRNWSKINREEMWLTGVTEVLLEMKTPWIPPSWRLKICVAFTKTNSAYIIQWRWSYRVVNFGLHDSINIVVKIIDINFDEDYEEDFDDGYYSSGVRRIMWV